MMKWMRERLAKDAGFTLVELMVVVLIIAILIAIAIPTFLGARQRAQDRAAQSDLRNALTAAKVFYTDTQDYAAVDTDLEAIEPSLDFDDTVANASDTVVGYIVEHVVAADTDSNRVTLVKQSASGTWFCLSDTAMSAGAVTSGTFYDSDAAAANIDDAAACNGTSW